MPRPHLPRTVVALGFVSFFNDLASEIVVPLIPILLATVLGAGPIALGVVEGVADALAAYLKLWSGRRSDLLGGRRKHLALFGYALSNVARPLLGLAGSWTAVLLLRGVDRVGKGIRTAPRDALVADTTPAEIRGYAFGFHRALDNAGAVGGSLLAAAVLAWSGMSLPHVIVLSAVPGVLAVICLAVFVRETRGAPAARTAAANVPPLAWSALSPAMRRYLEVLGLFTLGRASETFILLLGHDRGGSTVELLLLWSLLNLAKAATSTVGGAAADRLGRKAVITTSWVAFAATFALMAFVPGLPSLWAVTFVYGLFAGAGEGAERAVISDFARPGEQGTAFGWYNLVVGIAAIPAGVMFGGLWQLFGAEAAFALAACIAALAALLLQAWALAGITPAAVPARVRPPAQ